MANRFMKEGPSFAGIGGYLQKPLEGTRVNSLDGGRKNDVTQAVPREIQGFVGPVRSVGDTQVGEVRLELGAAELQKGAEQRGRAEDTAAGDAGQATESRSAKDPEQYGLRLVIGRVSRKHIPGTFLLGNLKEGGVALASGCCL